MKRYAIVRVDTGYCPNVFERIDKHYVCVRRKNGTVNCKKCKYGDTKEQLVAKVKQAIEREIQNKHILVDFKNFTMSITTRSLAKEIVEFLGVE